MRALKVLIVIMGVLLVVGFTILAVMIFRKFQGIESIHAEVPQEIQLPHDFKVIDISDVSDRAVIHLRSPANEEQILIVNPQNGQEVVRIKSGGK